MWADGGGQLDGFGRGALDACILKLSVSDVTKDWALAYLAYI